MKKLYLIGSLRNEGIPGIAKQIRAEVEGLEVFDDWYAAGPEADDYWKIYERDRGRDYETAITGYAARHVFNFDKHHLDTSDAAILVLPAGKSGHLELGYMAGRGYRTYILLDEEDIRWDVMYQFAGVVTSNLQEIINDIKRIREDTPAVSL